MEDRSGGRMSDLSHVPTCALVMSYADEPCDCGGVIQPAEASPTRLSQTAREHLEAARAALRGPKA